MRTRAQASHCPVALESLECLEADAWEDRLSALEQWLERNHLACAVAEGYSGPGGSPRSAGTLSRIYVSGRPALETAGGDGSGNNWQFIS